MERSALAFLKAWIASNDRQPLVIRGARQVGKTWLVRHLAEISGKTLIEVNLEKARKLAIAFSSNDPKEIIKKLGSGLETTINPDNALLFIDEIQEVPELFAKLRWFAEDMPELPVIAAGSLLEFVLQSAKMSMPVGRIGYLYLEPLSFEEFLLAHGKHALVSEIKAFTWKERIFEVTHEKLMDLFKEYIIVGGMPAAVKSWAANQSPIDLSRIHNSIMDTYRDDFHKYSKRISPERLQEVVNEVPLSLGKKFVYRNVNPDVRIPNIKEALDLLCNARLCHKVKSTAANGLPLSAEVNPLYSKVILLDVGLCSADLGLNLADLASIKDLDLINKGGIAEQVVGQLLRTISPFFQNPRLYYWLNTERFASAELDYVIQHKTQIIPLEIKSGTTGTLKSLHRFMHLKKRSLAVRINSDLPAINDIQVQDTLGNDIHYELRSIPFYLISEIHRLLE